MTRKKIDSNLENIPLNNKNCDERKVLLTSGAEESSLILETVPDIKIEHAESVDVEIEQTKSKRRNSYEEDHRNGSEVKEEVA